MEHSVGVQRAAAQVFKVYPEIHAGGERARMPQDLGDDGQRRILLQQDSGKRVPQGVHPVGRTMWEADSGAPDVFDHDEFGVGEPLHGSVVADEKTGRVGRRSAVLQIVHHRPPDVLEKRVPDSSPRFALGDLDELLVPFQVGKAQFAEVAHPYSQAGEHEQHGVVAFAGRIAPVHRFEQTADILGIPRTGYPRPVGIAHGRQIRGKIPFGMPFEMEKAQKGPDCGQSAACGLRMETCGGADVAGEVTGGQRRRRIHSDAVQIFEKGADKVTLSSSSKKGQALSDTILFVFRQKPLELRRAVVGVFRLFSSQDELRAAGNPPSL